MIFNCFQIGVDTAFVKTSNHRSKLLELVSRKNTPESLAPYAVAATHSLITWSYPSRIE